MRYYFYIPNNLDLDTILEEHEYTHIPAFSKDKLIFPLHCIAEMPSWYKDSITEDGYVNISGKTLQRWIGRDYRKYLDILVEARVIESNNHYTTNKHSTGFKYCDAYNKQLKNVLVTDTTLVQKLIRHYQQYKHGIGYDEDTLDSSIDSLGGASVDGYNSAERWYNANQIEIDHKLAHEYIEVTYAHKRSNVTLWDTEAKSDGSLNRKNPHTQYRSAYASIEKIKAGRFNHHRDNNIHRYHSAVTQCKRELRNAITVGGKNVTCVDISNSQPTLLTLIVDYQFWLNEKEFKSADIPYLGIKSMFKTDKAFNTFIMMCKNAEHNGSKKAELERFKELVASGNFYKEFSSLLIRKLNLSLNSLREVKSEFFTVLFTKNHFISQPAAKCKRAFKEWFPFIYELCRMIKVSSHANLPILLQRTESFIIFNRIVPRLVSEKPDMPFITIHDSIAVQTGNEDYVEQVMKEELEKCLGFVPHFKRENWKASILREETQRFQVKEAA